VVLTDSTALIQVDQAALEAVEAEVGRALRTGDDSGLQIVGWGEISTVLRLDTAAGAVVAKRLPLFAGHAELARYRDTFDRYLEELSARSVDVVPSHLQHVERPDGKLAVYCVQPLLKSGTLGPQLLARGDEAIAERFVQAVVRAIGNTVGPRLGLDGQASNWAMSDAGELRYLDVTTPLLRDEQGSELLDTTIFLASLPFALRPVVRRFLLSAIVDKYYEPRGVLLDLGANLIKEQQVGWLPLYLRHANVRLPAQPLDVAALRSYYRSDAAMWELLQRLRRADRWWQRKVRRRGYPFLLPGRIAR